jgi:hypothetical protein
MSECHGRLPCQASVASRLASTLVAGLLASERQASRRVSMRQPEGRATV